MVGKPSEHARRVVEREQGPAVRRLPEIKPGVGASPLQAIQCEMTLLAHVVRRLEGDSHVVNGRHVRRVGASRASDARVRRRSHAGSTRDPTKEEMWTIDIIAHSIVRLSASLGFRYRTAERKDTNEPTPRRATVSKDQI